MLSIVLSIALFMTCICDVMLHKLFAFPCTCVCAHVFVCIYLSFFLRMTVYVGVQKSTC